MFKFRMFGVAASAVVLLSVVSAHAENYGVQQVNGRGYAFALPSGWRYTESIAGVDLLSPDGITVASRVTLHGPGMMTPQRLTDFGLGAVGRKVTGIRITSQRARSYGRAQNLETEFTGTASGVQVHGVLITGVSNDGAGYDSQSVLLMAPEASWQQDVPTLARLAQSIHRI